MIVGRGYGYGRALGASGYGLAYAQASVTRLVLRLVSNIARIVNLDSKI